MELFPDLGTDFTSLGLVPMQKTTDARFTTGCGDVTAIGRTGDAKVEFIGFKDHTMALVNSSMGYPAYYPVHPILYDRSLRAILMDLDGTTVHSEEFWIWIIQQSTASLLGKPSFELENTDLPFVSGHSVSEHLQHCIRKYCPDKTVEDARKYYFEHTRREMKLILDGGGRQGAFKPSPGIKEFLLELKSLNLKIGLVTSGLYEKAYPEILDAFHTLGMGDPKEFYDAIITAGFALEKGAVGTLGELSPKPHPWLYAETARVGLGIPFSERGSVIGIEDSGAGICSIRLAGFMPLGIAGGNIEESGTAGLCQKVYPDFEHMLSYIKDRMAQK
jgi:beta-phosphoglucomutase-like phosphatase (HAD superfamily)